MLLGLSPEAIMRLRMDYLLEMMTEKERRLKTRKGDSLLAKKLNLQDLAAKVITTAQMTWN